MPYEDENCHASSHKQYFPFFKYLQLCLYVLYWITNWAKNFFWVLRLNSIGTQDISMKRPKSSVDPFLLAWKINFAFTFFGATNCNIVIIMKIISLRSYDYGSNIPRCLENCPQGKFPPVRVRVWFTISVRIRAGGNFPRGQFSWNHIPQCIYLSNCVIAKTKIGIFRLGLFVKIK